MIAAENSLIFTDLDGTLLDHFSYSFTPAVQYIEHLQNHQVPIVLNTSKTRDECIALLDEIDLNSPFIIENGAAVYLPKSKFSERPSNGEDDGEHWRVSFSRPRSHWTGLLQQLHPDVRSCFRGFSSMTHKELADETGLTEEAAILANQRQFTEPLKWAGTPEEQALMVTLVESLGGNVLQGGRFLHVGDKVSKGQAMGWFKELYQAIDPKRTIAIALGDSENDADMLEEADIAIVVKSPVHPYPQIRRMKPTVLTRNHGPEGWVEGLTKVLNF